MLEKKRKAGATNAERPTKKQTQGPSKSNLRVDLVTGSDATRPVIAVTNGVSLPSNLEFQSYTKTATDGVSSLLLHSSTHPTIDFKAIEGDLNTDQYLKHYVAVFDPTANTLQVTEAKRLTVRSCVRQRDREDDSDEEDTPSQPVTNYSSRAALTQTFGTKKSKKAVQATAENRLLARGGDDANNPLSNAILSSMSSPEPAEDVPPSLRTNKPLPVPNLTTQDVNEAYPLSSLVFPKPSLLDDMPIGYWRERISKQGEVKTSSRFIVNRVRYLVSALEADPSNHAILHKVQLLRYTLLLIELHTFLQSQGRFKKLPQVSAWPATAITGNIPRESLVELSKHFAPSGTGLSKNELTLLQSTILALTLHIPPPSLNAGANVLVTEPTDIQLDLAMKPEDVRKLYKELGCKVEHAKETELERWGLQKKDSKRKKEGLAAAPRPKFAKLGLPLVFPTVSAGRAQQRRR